MRVACALTVLLALGATALAEGEEELTPYSVPEIEQFLKVFKQTYNNTKQPEDDAIAVLADLQNAYRYIDSKGDTASKDETKAQKKIISYVEKGLKARKRPMVTLECARALGKIGDPTGAKGLLRWMDKVVLDAKSVNPNWVETGFLSLARIGGEDKQTLDLLIAYSSGRHVDISVAPPALRACYEWRSLSGKNRKELFEKVLNYLNSLWSNARGGDPKKRGLYDKRYKTVSEEGLKALKELSGADKSFANPEKALAWWKDNKRRRWEDYVGVSFREKETAAPPEKKQEEPPQE